MSSLSLFKDEDSYVQWGGSDEIIWKKNESTENTEEDYDIENGSFVANNKEFEDINPEFKKKLLDTKHRLYEESILKPDENSTQSQDIQLVDLYETYMKMFYLLTKQAEKNKPISTRSLSLFPVSVVPYVKDVLIWVAVFFSKNTPRETLPYSHYMELYLHTNPFFQDDLFINNKNRK